MTRPRRLIVGLGSPQGDDAAGWRVVDEIIRTAPSERVVCLAHPADLFDLMDDLDELIVCDACDGGDFPGAVRTWPWPLPAEFIRQNPRNSHELGLIEVLSVAEKLGQLPARIRVWTIEVGENTRIDVLSQAVQKALPEVVARILAAVQSAV